MCVYADFACPTIGASSALKRLAQSFAASLVVCALAVFGACGAALSVDTATTIAFRVEDTCDRSSFTVSVDAELAGGAVCAGGALRNVCSDAFEVAAFLTAWARLVGGTLCLSRCVTAVVDTGFADCAVRCTHTFKFRTWVTGAFFEVAKDGQTLCGSGAVVDSDIDTFEASGALMVIFTGATADTFAGGGCLVEVQPDAKCSWLTTVCIGFTDLTESRDPCFFGVAWTAVVIDTDFTGTTVDCAVAFDGWKRSFHSVGAVGRA